MTTKKKQVEEEKEDGRPTLKDIMGESTDSDVDESHILLHGPQGIGKTFAGVSVDPAWPDNVHEKKKPIVLDSIIHLGVDKGSLDGLRQYKLKVSHHINLRRLLQSKSKGPQAEDIMEALDWVTDGIEEATIKYKPIALVVDTLTRLSSMIAKYAEDLDFRTKKGEPDNFAKWAYVAAALESFWEWSANLPCMVICLTHSKPLGDENAVGVTRLDQLKMRSIKSLGDWDIVPALDGKKAFEVFTSNASLIATMEADRNDEGGYDRFICPRGGKGFMGKNRWFDCLDEREPANLRKMVEKIKKSGG